jgi:flagellar biosynthesis protein FlhF
MQVKRFEGVDMQEVLRLVKHELGPNAIILSTRQIKRGGGAFGMFGRPMIEVTAAVDRDGGASSEGQGLLGRRSTPAASEGVSTRETTDLTRVLEPLQRDMDQVKELLYQLAAKERLSPPVNVSGLEREFTVIKKMVEHLVQQQQDGNGPLFVGTLMPCYQRLLVSGMEEDLARRLAEKVQNSLAQEQLAEEQYVRNYFASTLIKTTPIHGSLPLTAGQCTTVAFVGPTGVGKTTTIAKLAAHYALGSKKKVALLTLDTYRIAAVEQLRTFAKIIGLSVDVVLSEAEMEQALARHRDKDLVLIDTAGRSQRDELQMAELVSCFAGGKRAILYLVLSATASASNLIETIERFKPLTLTSLIFTKLDECNAFGTLLSTALRTQLPLSYFTTGQRVPEDIEIATAERVVDLILNISQWSPAAGLWKEGRSA